MDGAALFASDKIRGLLEEGQTLLAAGRAHDALLAFERAALAAPEAEDVRAGLEAARAALSEAARTAEDSADAGGRAMGIAMRAAPFGGRATGLDRARGAGDDLGASGAPGRRSAPADLRERSRPRLVFAALCGSLFLVLGTGIGTTWDDLIADLGRTPSPRSEDGPTVAGETGPADPTGRARRLMAAGHPAAALLVLDSISPEDPAWPLARQLRGQVQGVLRPDGRPADRP
jgi:hypothetical protein